MDIVPRGALTNRAARQSAPLHCGRVSRFLIRADLKGEGNVTWMKGIKGFGFILFSLCGYTTVVWLWFWAVNQSKPNIFYRIVTDSCIYKRLMNLTCVHMYAESQTNRRRHHSADPVHLVCVVSSSLFQLDFIRAPQQLRSPPRTCQVIHSSDSGWGFAGRLFSCIFTAAWQPWGLHNNPIPCEMMSLLLVCRSVCGHGRWWSRHASANVNRTNGIVSYKDFFILKSDARWAYLSVEVSILTDPSLTDRSMLTEG